jgi:hypothetical protein
MDISPVAMWKNPVKVRVRRGEHERLLILPRNRHIRRQAQAVGALRNAPHPRVVGIAPVAACQQQRAPPRLAKLFEADQQKRV